MPTDKEKKRRTEDVGRILRILLRDEMTPPDEFAAKYIDLDEFKFLPSVEEIGDRAWRQGLLSFRFFTGGVVRFGGTGIILQVENPHEPAIKYGLKFSRPTFLDTPETEKRFFTQLKREMLNHTPLLHRNIVRIFGTTQDPLSEDFRGTPGRFHPIMMEWIDNAVPLNEYLKTRLLASTDTRSVHALIDKLIQGFSALSYIHSKNIIHWDVKSDNFLVDQNDGVLKLMDIGNARITTDNDRGDIALTTRGRYPKELDARRVKARSVDSSSNRCKIRLPSRDWDCAWLDMWMFSNSILQLVREHQEPYEPSEDSDRADKKDPKNRVSSVERAQILRNLRLREPESADFKLDCIRLILRRILVPRNPSENRYYHDAQEVIHDLEKIEPQFGAAQEVEELSGHPQNVMRIPVCGNVPYTARVANAYNSEPLRRLFSHYQLGPIHQVFPGATHRRSEHVAGVMSVTCEYIRALYADRTNPFWRLSAEHRDINSLLFAALLHDVGHIAFGHFIEEMEGLISGLTHEDYAQAVLDPTRLDKTGRYATSQAASADRQVFLKQAAQGWQVSESDTPESILATSAAYLKPAETTQLGSLNALYDRDACKEIKIKVIHSILDSAVDADKLDYIQRDAHHCGVPYASGIDKERFFQALTVIVQPEKLFGTIGVSGKGILPIESILIARYQLFRSVYWHHTVRAQTAMLKYLVEKCVTGALDLDKPIVGDFAGSIFTAVEQLLATFRRTGDDDAIRILRGSLGSCIKDQGLRLRLRRICDALLGERPFLYKRVFELNDEPTSAL